MILSTLVKISDPVEVRRKFERYRGRDNSKLYISERNDKKYKVLKPDGKIVHFGSRMADFTRHGDEKRRQAYQKRSAGVKGDWRDDKYSAANLARELLW